MNLTSKRFFLKSAFMLAAVGCVLLPTVSIAEPINYGSFEGTSVWFRNVTEGSLTDNAPLFGVPTVSGDSLDFDQVGFSASAADRSIDNTDGDLGFSVEAKSLKGVETILLSEAGDTSLIRGETHPTARAYTEVRTTVYVNIGQTNTGATSISHVTQMVFTPSGGSFDLDENGGGDDSFSTNWNGTLLIDIGDILEAHERAGEIATLVYVQIDNFLLAITEVGSVATIATNDSEPSGLTLYVNSIPEPGSGDFDNDGDVDGSDFLYWQRNPTSGNLADWQTHYGNGALTEAVSVPEPGTMAMLIFAAALASWTKRTAF
jgi:hypothetical protein